MRGARPRRPAATSRTISATSRKPALERAPVLQVGALAGPLAEPHAGPPQAPSAIASPNDSMWCRPGRQQERQRRADQQVVDVALQLRVEPHQLAVVEHRAALGLEHPRGAGVDDDQPGLGVEVARVAPAVGLGVLVGAVGQRVERVADVELARPVVRRDPLPQLVRAALLGAEVAEVLVDPVRRRVRRRSGRATSSVASMSWRHVQLVFQSSRMSWSSKIIARRQRREQPPVGRVATTRAGRGGRTPRSP